MTCGAQEFNGTHSNEVKCHDESMGFLDSKSNKSLTHMYVYYTTDLQIEIMLFPSFIMEPYTRLAIK